MAKSKSVRPAIPANPLCDVDAVATVTNVADLIRYMLVHRKLDGSASVDGVPSAENLLGVMLTDALGFAAAQVEAGDRQLRVASTPVAS